MHQQPITIAVTASFTAEPLQESLEFWSRELNLPIQCRFAPYNQMFQQLLDPQSILARNQHGINVVLLRLEAWQQLAPDPVDGWQQLDQHVADFIGALQTAIAGAAVPYLVCICPASPQIADDPPCREHFTVLEQRIASALAETPGAHVVSSAALQQLYPVARYYRPNGDQLGGIPFTAPLFAALGTQIIRVLIALLHPPYKVIVLDCDHTLWNGICGEDVVAGLSISPPYRALQAWMIGQHQAGMLLCICSKNNESDVDAVFTQHPDMLLRPEHIVGRRVNWSRKAINIRSLAAELALGLDSFIFIDNDALECAEMRAACPEVLTLQLPADPEAIPSFLAHVWAFDRLKVTAEDQQRTAFYRQNAQREQLRSESLSLGNFLEHLGLEVEIHPMAPADSARVAQLTQRTNQFNTTTIRRSEEAVRALGQGDAPSCFVTHVRDRFGDYGLVGVIICQSTEDALVIESMLLSCRALGRGVEHRMLAELGRIAEAQRLRTVVVPYLPSSKNRPALDFLNQVGASLSQPDGQGMRFSFPTAAAISARFAPEHNAPLPQSASQPADGTAAQREIGHPLRLTSTQIQRIATELADAKAIWQLIRDEKFARLAQV